MTMDKGQTRGLAATNFTTTSTQNTGRHKHRKHNNIIQLTGKHVETLHYSPTYYTIELCVTKWLSWLILLAYCN